MKAYIDADGHEITPVSRRTRCEICRYFSDALAKWHGNNQTVRAMCLNKDSPYFQKYQPINGTCSQHEMGVPIDARNKR